MQCNEGLKSPAGSSHAGPAIVGLVADGCFCQYLIMQKVSTRLQRHFKGTHLIHHLRQACQWSCIWDAKLLALPLPNPRPERWGQDISRDARSSPITPGPSGGP
jgi:hypothetical protein